MSTPREWVRRLWGTIRRRRSDADLEEELRLHLELAADEARRQTGGVSAPGTGGPRPRDLARAMDALRDQRGLPRLDALAADVVFGFRQLKKHRAASAAAILSLAVAIGAVTAAFRLVDAVLLRPMPVASPDTLFAVATAYVGSDNRLEYSDDFDYPTYREFSSSAGGSADLMVVGMAARYAVLFGDSDAPENVIRQYVSGNVFPKLGLTPVLGRLLTPEDDLRPGAHPVAVLSHDFWTRRFARDPAAVGATFRAGGQRYEIVGVAPQGFVGTEPGTVTDLFLPAMMNAKAIDSPGWSWFRIWLRPRPEVGAEQIREMLQARFRADRRERAAGFSPSVPKEQIDRFLREEVRLFPAGSGVSELQKTFRRPLLVLASLAAFVLLIACANVANLLTAQAASRTREMALRVSIGAARSRLIQLVLIESALLAIVASALGMLFASWAAPLVVSMLGQVERPVRLVLDLDWRALSFGAALALTVTGLFGLAPALRASAIEPLRALKGDDPHAPRRLTTALVGIQTAVCVFLLVAAALFVGTFDRLVNRPLGFTHAHLFVVETEGRAKHAPEGWAQVTDHVQRIPGVESVAVAGWAPLSGNRWRGTVEVPGRAIVASSPHFVGVSAGYFATLRIGMIEGRDFRIGDLPPGEEHGVPRGGVGVVNEAFARTYFDGRTPVGRRVSVNGIPLEIVGLVRDAAYYDVREQMHPAVYVPMEARDNAVLLVRMDARAPASMTQVRDGVSRAGRDLRVRAVAPLTGFVRQQMIRERLLAALSAFFALVAVVLAGIGLYGVLNYAVIRQRREIGIRMALGARAVHIVRRVTIPMLAAVCVGSAAGLAGGFAFGRVIRTLLFEIRLTDPATLVVPMLVLAAAALLSALPAAVRAVHIDPAQTLRQD